MALFASSELSMIVHVDGLRPARFRGLYVRTGAGFDAPAITDATAVCAACRKMELGSCSLATPPETTAATAAAAAVLDARVGRFAPPAFELDDETVRTRGWCVLVGDEDEAVMIGIERVVIAGAVASSTSEAGEPTGEADGDSVSNVMSVK